LGERGNYALGFFVRGENKGFSAGKTRNLGDTILLMLVPVGKKNC
jgi:hypothetical protein